MTKARMKKLCFVLSVLAGILTWANSSQAACIGSSPTWMSSPDQSSVASCVSSATSGDTINVLPGSAIWSNAIDISSKDLTIIGAGNGPNPASNTIITRTGNCFQIGSGGTSSASRLSNFRFIDCMISLQAINPSKGFRIDHNYFEGTSNREMVVSGYNYPLPPSGLFDHNTLELTRFVIYGTAYMFNEANWQHQIWASDPDFGGPQAIYIEDNTITANHPGTIDANYGGRFVYRFNNVRLNGTYAIEFHGVQGHNRAGQRWEIYGNNITNTGAQTFTTAFLRGATGYYFNNTRSGLFSTGVVLKVERSSETKDPFGQCNGTWLIDGNTPGFEGWPCRDQIGRSRDSNVYSGTGNWPAQASTPAYSWNNSQGGVQYGFSSYNGSPREQFLQNLQNRDWYNFNALFNGTTGVGVGAIAARPATCTAGVAYWATDEGEWNSRNTGADGQLYKCTSANTWTLYYKPYPYPHPLQAGINGGGQPSPLAPANLKFK